MIEGVKELFVLIADHSGQLAPLLAFALVTVATLPHAAAGRARQALAGLIAGAAFVGMYAMFTVTESRDIRNLLDSPMREVVMAAMFCAFALFEGVAATALLVGRHGIMPITAEPSAEPPAQD